MFDKPPPITTNDGGFPLRPYQQVVIDSIKAESTRRKNILCPPTDQVLEAIERARVK